MKLIAAGLTSTILAAGLVGSVSAYRSQVGEIEPGERPLATPSVLSSGSEAANHVRWAPCPAPSRLEKGVCVTDVTRTVVIPSASIPGPAQGDDGNGPDDD